MQILKSVVEMFGIFNNLELVKSEFGRKMLSGDGFGGSLVRQCMFAVSLTVKNEDTREGLNWLHTELPDYWASREKVIHILEYLSGLRHANP